MTATASEMAEMEKTMSPFQFAKQEISSGRFPMMPIVAGEFGTFWIEDSNYRSLEHACFTSREAAEKARSKAIEKAMKNARAA